MKNMRIMPHRTAPHGWLPQKGQGPILVGNHRCGAYFLLLAASLSSCATFGNPNVRTIGPEIFALQETMPKKAAEAKAVRLSLIKEAKAFCAKRGQSVEINNEDMLDATSRIYQLTFQCPQGLAEDNGVGALTFPKPIAVNPKASASQPDADNLGF